MKACNRLRIFRGSGGREEINQRTYMNIQTIVWCSLRRGQEWGGGGQWGGGKGT